MSDIRLAVVDDHPLFRDGVSRSLSEIGGFVVVAEGSSKDDAVRICVELRPDVVLLDISLPGGGLKAVDAIMAVVPEQRIVMLTVSEQPDDVETALRSGARGYVLKGIGGRALADVVELVAAGQTYVAPTLSARLIADRTRGGAASAGVLDAMTARERDVLGLVAEGLTNKHIARRLSLQEKTVKHHMTQILAKLQLTNRTEAALAVREELDSLRR